MLEGAGIMKAERFFAMMDAEVPLNLALAGDRVGFLGPGDPETLDVENVLVMMDYFSGRDRHALDGGDYDLLVLHHPPLQEPDIPAYVAHSNWDLVHGGACDALADSLALEVEGVLDAGTGLGRVGTIRSGPVSLGRYARMVMETLGVEHLRIVNYDEERMIERVGVVSGFGLRPDLIEIAADQGVDLYVSGDLTHQGAIRAKNMGLALIDATHHATEVPGLYRLGECVARMGLKVHVLDTGIPWQISSLKKGA